MNARVRKVVDEFLELTPEERELAKAEIEASLEDEDTPEEMEKAWATEIERRARQVLEGKSTGRPADEVFAELKARIAARSK